MNSWWLIFTCITSVWTEYSSSVWLRFLAHSDSVIVLRFPSHISARRRGFHCHLAGFLRDSADSSTPAWLTLLVISYSLLKGSPHLCVDVFQEGAPCLTARVQMRESCRLRHRLPRSENLTQVAVRVVNVQEMFHWHLCKGVSRTTWRAKCWSCTLLK